jgi:hypothetical protein
MVSGKGPGAPTKPRQSSPRKKNGGGEHPETTGPATTGPAEPATEKTAARRKGALSQIELTEEQQHALFHDHLRNYKKRLATTMAKRFSPAASARPRRRRRPTARRSAPSLPRLPARICRRLPRWPTRSETA